MLLLERFDISPDGEIVDLVTGPARDGQLLEVFLHRHTPRTISLFHVLHLRPKSWNRAQDVIRTRKKEALP
ncbi:hypothetical protein [Plantibacter sp. YIM 135249]|uniref:hypothetical protein n=1 Tax=Plantibacter sp. YIM 135249 TaxID=3423918 RepID=UPI003D327800